MKEIVIKSDGHTAKLFVDGREVNKEPYRICAACDVALGGEDNLPPR